MLECQPVAAAFAAPECECLRQYNNNKSNNIYEKYVLIKHIKYYTHNTTQTHLLSHNLLLVLRLLGFVGPSCHGCCFNQKWLAAWSDIVNISFIFWNLHKKFICKK